MHLLLFKLFHLLEMFLQRGVREMPILLQFREKVGTIGHAVPVVLFLVFFGQFDCCEMHENSVAMITLRIDIFLEEDSLL